MSEHRPLTSIRVAAVAALVAAVLLPVSAVSAADDDVADLCPDAPTDLAQFSDVPDSRDDAEHILCARRLGFVNGTTDTAYAPDDPLTRAQSASILHRVITKHSADACDTASQSGFSDVDSAHWAAEEIGCLAELEIVNGYSDGTFKPDDHVAVTALTLMSARAVHALTDECSSSDGTVADAAACLSSRGFEISDSDSSQAATRGQTAVYAVSLWRFVSAPETPSVAGGGASGGGGNGSEGSNGFATAGLGGEQATPGTSQQQQPQQNASFAAAGTLTAGSVHTCGVTTAAAADCWGVSAADQTGPFKMLAAGGDHNVCAIKTDDTLQCWGSSTSDLWGVTSPPAGTYTDVGVDQAHACAISASDKAISCWGYIDGDYGRPPAGQFDALAVGNTTSCAIRSSDKSVQCWGANLPPKTGAPTSGQYASISAHSSVYCALSTTGTAVCWGSHASVASAPSTAFAAVAVGAGHACGLAHSTGYATCWGDAYTNQGSGSEQWPATSTVPTNVAYVAIAAGAGYTCAVEADGDAVCWGIQDARTQPPSTTFRTS